jgi:hypothetical protein
MESSVFNPFVAGPRFQLPAQGAVGHALLQTQLRRAVRALIDQRGGVLLMRAWGTDASVRIECTVARATASIVLSTDNDETASVIRGMSDALTTECARRGCALARISCAMPVAGSAAA